MFTGRSAGSSVEGDLVIISAGFVVLVPAGVLARAAWPASASQT